MAEDKPAALEVTDSGEEDEVGLNIIHSALHCTALQSPDWASDGGVSRLLAALRGLCLPGGEDVLLLCGAGEVAAYAAILPARSPVLARRLLPAVGGVAGRPVHFQLEGLQLAGLEVAVGYMYTGVVESGEAGLGPVVEAAARL